VAGGALIAEEIAIPRPAPFQEPLTGRRIHTGDAEPGAVAKRPLEVVDQRPNEVPTDVHTRGDCIPDRGDVPLEIFDALRVVDHAADDPVIGIGRTVLQHVEG
jgi:hypothetical protein